MRLPIFIVLFLCASAARAADAPREIDPREDAGTSQAVVVGDVAQAHTAQVFPLVARGRVVAPGDAAKQSAKVLDELAALLAEARADAKGVVKLNVYAADQGVVPEIQRVVRDRFRGAVRPAVCYVVGKLAHPEALVAMDAVAVSALDPGLGVKVLRGGRVAVLPPGSRIYVAGQAEKGATLAEATRKTLASLRKTLEHLGRADADVVQVKAFVNPVGDTAAVREELAAFYGRDKVPPAVFVEWTYPQIEIELIAWGGQARAGEAVEYLTPPGMTASPVFSRVARVNHGGTIYTAGLYGRGADAGAEVEDIFAQLTTLLGKAGGDLRHMAKATYYVATDESSRKLNELRPRYYDPKRPPSASKAGVAGTGRPGHSLTLDMIAVPSKHNP